MPFTFGHFKVDGRIENNPYVLERYIKKYGGWNASRFEMAVYDVMAKLQASQVGQIVMGHVRRAVVITPFPDPFKRNATACSFDREGATPDGVQFRSRALLVPEVHTGTGSGSEAGMRFTPRMWGKEGAQAEGAGAAADEVLCHELVHAMRNTNGLRRPIPTSGAAADFDNFEEVIAITVTNLLSSETKRRLRRDHHGAEVMSAPDPVKAGKAFAKQHEHALLRVMVLHRPFGEALAALKLPFNPFAYL